MPDRAVTVPRHTLGDTVPTVPSLPIGEARVGAPPASRTGGTVPEKLRHTLERRTTHIRPAYPSPHMGDAADRTGTTLGPSGNGWERLGNDTPDHASHARLRKPFGPSNASALRGLSRSPRRRIRRRYGARVACHFDMSLVALRPRSTAGPLGQVGEQSLAQFSGVGAWLSRGTPAIQATGGLQ